MGCGEICVRPFLGSGRGSRAVAALKMDMTPVHTSLGRVARSSAASQSLREGRSTEGVAWHHKASCHGIDK